MPSFALAHMTVLCRTLFAKASSDKHTSKFNVLSKTDAEKGKGACARQCDPAEDLIKEGRKCMASVGDFVRGVDQRGGGAGPCPPGRKTPLLASDRVLNLLAEVSDAFLRASFKPLARKYKRY